MVRDGFLLSGLVQISQNQFQRCASDGAIKPEVTGLVSFSGRFLSWDKPVSFLQQEQKWDHSLSRCYLVGNL